MSKVNIEFGEVKRPVKRVKVSDIDIKDRALVIQPSKSVSGALTFYVQGRLDSRVRVSKSDIPELLLAIHRLHDGIPVNAFKKIDHVGEVEDLFGSTPSSSDLIVTFTKGEESLKLNFGNIRRPVALREWQEFREIHEKVIKEILNLMGEGNE